MRSTISLQPFKTTQNDDNLAYAIFGQNNEGTYTYSTITDDQQSIMAAIEKKLKHDKSNDGTNNIWVFNIKGTKLVRIPNNPISLTEFNSMAEEDSRRVVCFDNKAAINKICHTKLTRQTTYIYWNKKHYQAVDYLLPKITDPLLRGRREYTASGTKNSLHGVIYQLKLLMLFLHHSSKKYPQFFLATERNDADKFDDVVLTRKEQGQSHYRYLQAKHKQDSVAEKSCISLSHLLPVKKPVKNSSATQQGALKKEDIFNLIKYFNAYQKIINHRNFKDGEWDEFCICTNIDFDSELMAYLEEDIEADPILLGPYTPRKAKKYRFIEAKLSNLKDTNDKNVYQRLQESDEYLVLAKALYQQTPKKGQKKRVKISFKTTPLYGKKDWFIEKGIINSGGYLTLSFINGTNLKDNVVKQMSQYYRTYKEGETVTSAITNEDINNFFRKLVFAVNQPNELELDAIIQANLQTSFNLIDTEASYAQFQRAALDWMKEKQGRFLDKSALDSLINHIQQKAANMLFTVPTEMYEDELKRFNLKFEPCEKFNEAFNDQEEKPCIYFAPGDLSLVAAKVLCTLSSISNENKPYTFITLKQAMAGSKFLIDQLPSPLIIICDTEIINEWGFLISYIRSHHKKVIFVTNNREFIPLIQACDEGEEEEISVFEGAKANLANLTTESTKKVKEYQIFLQGNEIQLKQLGFKLNTIIDSDTLLKIANEQVVQIGRPLPYIKKELISTSNLPIINPKEEYIVLSGVAGVGKSTWLTAWAHELKEDPLCWVVKVCLLDIKDKLQNLDRKNPRSIAQTLLMEASPLEQNIFSAYLNTIKSQNPPTMKIALLIDHFDEVNEIQQEKVKELLATLTDSGLKQIIVTTRLPSSTPLSIFGNSATHYHLQGLTEEEAISYIRQFWLNEEGMNDSEYSLEHKNDFNQFIKNIITQFINSGINFSTFINNPLHANLFAITFSNNFKGYFYDQEDSSTNPKIKDNLAVIYKQFTRKKYEIFLQEKYQPSYSNAIPEEIEKQLIDNLNNWHERLAFESLFPNPSKLTIASKMADHTCSFIQRAGIVQFDQETKECSFIHESFIHYFAAKLVVKKLEKVKDDGKNDRYQPFIQTIQDKKQAIHHFLNGLIKPSSDTYQVWKTINEVAKPLKTAKTPLTTGTSRQKRGSKG